MEIRIVDAKKAAVERCAEAIFNGIDWAKCALRNRSAHFGATRRSD